MNAIERWRSMVGARSEPVANVVERGAVRKFAEAIGDPSLLYVDEAAARRSRHGGLIAPPTFPRTFDYGEIEGMNWPESGMIHGEHNILYARRPLLVGEEVSCYTAFEDYYEKEGRDGTLGFLVVGRIGDGPGGERLFAMRDVAVVTPALRRTLGA